MFNVPPDQVEAQNFKVSLISCRVLMASACQGMPLCSVIDPVQQEADPACRGRVSHGGGG